MFYCDPRRTGILNFSTNKITLDGTREIKRERVRKNERKREGGKERGRYKVRKRENDKERGRERKR